MRTVDIFIVLRFLSYFLGSLFVLVILFVAVDVMTNLNRFGSSASVLMSYYVYYIPFVAYNMVPVSALLALVTLVSGLVRTSELVALNSLGYSLFSILRGVLFLLVFLVGFLIWTGDVLIPFAMEKRNYIYYIEMKKQPGIYAKTKTKNIWYRTKSAIIHFETVLDDTHILGAHIYFVSPEWKLIRMIEAQSLVVQSQVWKLKGVKDSNYIPESEAFQVQSFDNLEIPALTQLENMKMSGNATDYLSSRDLIEIIKRNQEIALDTTQLKITLYSKFTFALSVLILPFLGLCTISTNRRSGNAMLSGAIAVVIVFVYWMLYNSALSYGKAGVLPPLLAVVIVPLLVVIAIGFAIRRVLN